MTELSKLFKLQEEWSSKAFGTAPKTKGVMEHIRKETLEVEQNPDDIEEYADLLVLVIDASWRRGFSAEELWNQTVYKMVKNAKRNWPPLSEQDPDKPVEHVKGFND